MQRISSWVQFKLKPPTCNPHPTPWAEDLHLTQHIPTLTSLIARPILARRRGAFASSIPLMCSCTQGGCIAFSTTISSNVLPTHPAKITWLTLNAHLTYGSTHSQQRLLSIWSRSMGRAKL